MSELLTREWMQPVYVKLRLLEGVGELAFKQRKVKSIMERVAASPHLSDGLVKPLQVTDTDMVIDHDTFYGEGAGRMTRVVITVRFKMKAKNTEVQR